jgi:hypothetical protein
MRDYTITRLNRGGVEADLYENGSWVDSIKGSEGEVMAAVRVYLKDNRFATTREDQEEYSPRLFRSIMT